MTRQNSHVICGIRTLLAAALGFMVAGVAVASSQWDSLIWDQDIWACDGDTDCDDVPNVSDNCVHLANSDQNNFDKDPLGDVCDPDADGDGWDIAQEAAAGTDPLNPDTDGDGVIDNVDPEPLNPNSSSNYDNSRGWM